MYDIVDKVNFIELLTYIDDKRESNPIIKSIIVKLFQDKYGEELINWWLNKPKNKRIIVKNGSKMVVKTPEQLYDYLYK